MEKIFCKKNIKIFNWILSVLVILIFEFGYCNWEFTIKTITDQASNGFHISLCRIVFYIVCLIGMYFLNKSIVIEEAEKSYTTKIKKYVTIIFIIGETLVFLFYSYKFAIKRDLYLIQYSVVCIFLIATFFAIENFTNKFLNNIIAIACLGSIFCITVNIYHTLDEKRHFMSAYNISYANLDFNNPVVDKQFMEELPRGLHYTAFASFFRFKI